MGFNLEPDLRRTG